MTGRRSFDHDGIRFGYADHGSGAAVVLQHGLGADASQPADLLGSPVRRVTLECRGHGATEPLGPEEALTFATFAADLRALLDHLGLERVVLGGISMGAGVALRLALDAPWRVRALVLIRPAWLDRPGPEHLAIFPEIAALLRELPAAAARAELLRSPRLHVLRAESGAAAASALGQLDRPRARERAPVLARLPADAPLAPGEDLGALTMPALVVASRRDPVHPFALASALCERLPAARLVTVASKEDGEERHRREVATAIDDLLASEPDP